jgi:hypothetical protein
MRGFGGAWGARHPKVGVNVSGVNDTTQRWGCVVVWVVRIDGVSGIVVWVVLVVMVVGFWVV